MHISKELLQIDLYEFLINQGATEVKDKTSKKYPYFQLEDTKIFLFKTGGYGHFNLFQTANEQPLIMKFSPGKNYQGNIGELALLLSNNNVELARNLLNNYINAPIIPAEKRMHGQDSDIYNEEVFNKINDYFRKHLINLKYAQQYLRNRFIADHISTRYNKDIFCLPSLTKSKVKYFPLAFPVYNHDNKIIAVQRVLPDRKIFVQKSTDESFNKLIGDESGTGFQIFNGIWKSIIDSSSIFVISESPIDSLSYAQLYDPEKFNLLASYGSLTESKILHIINTVGSNQVICAFDNDHAGLINTYKILMAFKGIPAVDFSISWNKAEDCYVIRDTSPEAKKLKVEPLKVNKSDFVGLIKSMGNDQISIAIPQEKDFNKDLELKVRKPSPDNITSTHSKILNLCFMIYPLQLFMS